MEQEYSNMRRHVLYVALFVCDIFSAVGAPDMYSAYAGQRQTNSYEAIIVLRFLFESALYIVKEAGISFLFCYQHVLQASDTWQADWRLV